MRQKKRLNAQTEVAHLKKAELCSMPRKYWLLQQRSLR